MNIPTFPFLSGRLNQFATIPIEGFNQSLADGVFNYVAKHGFHYTPSNHKKLIVVPRMKASKDERTYSIEFRSLFMNSIDNGVISAGQRDYHRYQTGPDDGPKLLKACKSLQQLLNLAQINIDKQVEGYVATEVSILYSLPNGKPQGFHMDNYHSDALAKRDGPLLCISRTFQR
jgi:hypothetical protein